jgi:hypothetical protein
MKEDSGLKIRQPLMERVVSGLEIALGFDLCLNLAIWHTKQTANLPVALTS